MIKTENLSFAYSGDEGVIKVLNQLNIEIQTGEFVAVLGHNGSGKSTFAKQLNAILTPGEGKVTVFGIDTSLEENVYELRKNVGMVFQNPDNQIVATIVEEDVAFGLENLGVPREEMRRRVDEALKTVRMYDYRHHAPHLLSGGQKQRVAIAGILAMEPKCIVLDEPTAMLDPIGRDEVLETISRLNKEKGITIVLITHYMDEAVKAGRCIVMDKGQVVMDGEPTEIFPRVEELRALGLDVPQATELIYELKKRGVNIGANILQSDDCIKVIKKFYDIIKSQSFMARKNKKVTRASILPEQTIKPTLFKLKNINYTYNKDEPSARVALKDVSLQLRDGDFVGLIGHTGSGKSTLMQVLAGLLPPIGGELVIDGQGFPDYKSAAREIRRRVGLVFQYPEHQLFEETVYKDIAFGPTNQGLSGNELDERVREAAKRVNLPDELLEKSPFDLSGGQKRRAAIAGVVAMKPELLILDEPTAGLDPEGRDELLAMLKDLHGDWCKTIVLVSHSMEDIAKTVNTVAVMNRGSLVMLGSVAEVFSRGEELREMGLNTPQISRIIDGLIAAGLPLRRDIFTVEAAAEAIAGLIGGRKNA